MEMVDMQDLGSCAVRRVGSNPTTHPTFYQNAMTLGYRQAVRQRILIPSCAGSNPATLANPAT